MSQLPVALSSRAASAKEDTPIRYACRLAPNTVLCCGQLAYGLTGKETIQVDGVTARKPYLAGRLIHSEPQLTAILLRVDEGYLIESLGEVAFTHEGGIYYWYNEAGIDENGIGFAAMIDALPPGDVSKIYYLMLKYSGLQPSVASDPHFLALCRACHEKLRDTSVPYAHAFWLLPGTLYLEAPLPPPEAEPLRAVHVGPEGFLAARADISALQMNYEGNAQRWSPALLHFSASQGREIGEGALAILLKDRLITLPPLPACREADTAGFIGHLRSLPESSRLAVRDFVIRHFVTQGPDARQDLTAGLVRNLQCYLPPTHSTLCNPSQPFGLNVEAAYTVGREGIFLCGWMHDPLQMRRELLLHSDLGYALAIDNALHFYPRLDVEELYRDSSFPPSGSPQGFAAYIEFSEAHRARHLAWPESYAYRVSAHLQGGLSYTVAPVPLLADPFTLRGRLLSETMAAWIGNDTAALDALGKAARRAQETCALQAEPRRILQFGAPPSRPRISVVIPLYKTLDYVAAQVAHFSADPAMQGVEVLYVLDAPVQEERVERMLRDISLLYRFPLKLVVMSHNGGFAVASNQGAKEARGDYLLLMNSDILPIDNGWIAALLDAHDRTEKPGAVAPMLLYEDGGIQHAGMYFSFNAEGGHYENLHYFKGYPASHPQARVSRPVPAVSAACMLIGRKAFEKAGRFTTDYVLGDFEDSDLCLKLTNLGFTNVYCAEACLYHFERQSFAKAAAADSLRYRINAREHHRRWEARIGDLMEDCHG